MSQDGFNTSRDFDKAARCGEPSYVWRQGQERRLGMILDAAGVRINGEVLENGCGIGMYIDRLASQARKITGLEYDLQRAQEAHNTVAAKHSNAQILCAAGEWLPFPRQTFDLILSHEVLEHVVDDHRAVGEMVRVLKPGGRMVIFVPNRGYPFETHGIFWRGEYRFGNIPLINYLPRRLRDQLAPHVRIYGKNDLAQLFKDLPVRIITRTIIFGAYDNIIARWPTPGKALRAILHVMERSPLKTFGLSHLWVVEKL